MAYQKTTWANGQSPAIDAEHLNKIEQGIFQNADDIAKKPDAVLEATYVYVSASGNDTTGTGSINAPFRTVQAAVDSLPRCLTADTTIKVLDGAYEENVVLKGFFGGGSLTLAGSDGVSVRTIQLNGCACAGTHGIEDAVVLVGSCVEQRQRADTGLCGAPQGVERGAVSVYRIAQHCHHIAE